MTVLSRLVGFYILRGLKNKLLILKDFIFYLSQKSHNLATIAPQFYYKIILRCKNLELLYIVNKKTGKRKGYIMYQLTIKENGKIVNEVKVDFNTAVQVINFNTIYYLKKSLTIKKGNQILTIKKM